MLKTQLADYDTAMAGPASPPGVLIPADRRAPLQESNVNELRARVGDVTVLGVGMQKGTFYSLYVAKEDEEEPRGELLNPRASVLARMSVLGDALLVGDAAPKSAKEKYLDLTPEDAQRLMDDIVCSDYTPRFLLEAVGLQEKTTHTRFLLEAYGETPGPQDTYEQRLKEILTEGEVIVCQKIVRANDA